MRHALTTPHGSMPLALTSLCWHPCTAFASSRSSSQAKRRETSVRGDALALMMPVISKLTRKEVMVTIAVPCACHTTSVYITA